MLGGDLIVAMDGEEITSPQDLSAAMNAHRSGDTVTLTIFRGRRRMDVKVTLGDARELQGRGGQST
jgi:Trypsin-like serine proteases, typically periplasmic, contain C-terminal PDZ domain